MFVKSEAMGSWSISDEFQWCCHVNTNTWCLYIRLGRTISSKLLNKRFDRKRLQYCVSAGINFRLNFIDTWLLAFVKGILFAGFNFLFRAKKQLRSSFSDSMVFQYRFICVWLSVTPSKWGIHDLTSGPLHFSAHTHTHMYETCTITFYSWTLQVFDHDYQCEWQSTSQAHEMATRWIKMLILFMVRNDFSLL